MEKKLLYISFFFSSNFMTSRTYGSLNNVNKIKISAHKSEFFFLKQLIRQVVLLWKMTFNMTFNSNANQAYQPHQFPASKMKINEDMILLNSVRNVRMFLSFYLFVGGGVCKESIAISYYTFSYYYSLVMNCP